MGTYLRGRLSKIRKQLHFAVEWRADFGKAGLLLPPGWGRGPVQEISKSQHNFVPLYKALRTSRTYPELLELCGNLNLDDENSVNLIVGSKMELRRYRSAAGRN
jgi:hypothetical protein